MKKLYNVDYHLDIDKKLKNFIKSKNIKLEQKGMHFGNFCLINIPEKIKEDIWKTFVQEIKNDKLLYRNCKTIIEEKDFDTFAVNDKVTIEYLETAFFPVINQKGTIYAIKKNCLIIRAYKNSIKGWKVYVGENCKISKGWGKERSVR